MLLDSSSFRGLNTQEHPEWMGLFSLEAPPNSDLWRKPPSRDTSTAPVLYTCLRHPFVAAEVTVTADWELEWDQGGLVIFAGVPPGHSTVNPVPRPTNTAPSSTTQPQQQNQQQQQPPPSYTAAVPPPTAASKWVKAGLEFCNGAPHASSVSATPDGADWALATLSPQHAHQRMDLRIKLERIGYALWIWFEDTVNGWRKLREVTWFFWGVEDKAVRVGVYASRPANFGTMAGAYGRRGNHENLEESREQRVLVVEFDGLEIF
ncbi:MAG: hypothetical protein M1816_001928 [Peltula sp. TS41687]|nr:MAG: hypothetical protein M1816_001928 [Peltula sp. TS41687]